MAGFQLHHTGIKTTTDAEVLVRESEFQLHHTGIKTKDLALAQRVVEEISIAPYRN